MRLAHFITEHLEEILKEWEAFASSLLSPGEVMTSLALRDHASPMLLAIAADIELFGPPWKTRDGLSSAQNSTPQIAA